MRNALPNWGNSPQLPRGSETVYSYLKQQREDANVSVCWVSQGTRSMHTCLLHVLLPHISWVLGPVISLLCVDIRCVDIDVACQCRQSMPAHPHGRFWSCDLILLNIVRPSSTDWSCPHHTGLGLPPSMRPCGRPSWQYFCSKNPKICVA